MSSSGLVRFCGLAAIGAGALLVVADLLSLTISPKGPSVESLTSGAYAVSPYSSSPPRRCYCLGF